MIIKITIKYNMSVKNLHGIKKKRPKLEKIYKNCLDYDNNSINTSKINLKLIESLPKL